MKKKISLLLITSLLFGTFAGCTSSSPVSKTGFYFDTVVTITLYDGSSKLIDDCFEICSHLDDLLNKNKSESEISKINNLSVGDSIELSKETLEIIELGQEYYEKSNGALSLYCGQVTSLWDYQSDNPMVPDSADIENALNTNISDAFSITGTSIKRVKSDTCIDVGAIAKGYIADNLRTYLLNKGVKKALINLGGNIVCITDNDLDTFNIGIQKPFSNDGEVITSVKLRNGSVVTSGTYQRYFEADGKVYHHIIDLNTGYPCDNDLNSVSIICYDSSMADALSTIVFLKGLDEGLKYVEAIDGVEAIFIDKADNIYKTSGL